MGYPCRAARTPEAMPATWYCRDCAAMLPRTHFTLRNYRVKDGSVAYHFRHRCDAHHRAIERERARSQRSLLAGLSREERRAETARRALQEAEERVRVAARKQARAAVVCRYVAGLWDQTPAWLLARARWPDQVEARALVAVILYDEHHFGLSETARVIERDHSTALHLLKRYRDTPELQDLLGDYRRWRAQRRAARVATRKAG